MLRGSARIGSRVAVALALAALPQAAAAQQDALWMVGTWCQGPADSPNAVLTLDVVGDLVQFTWKNLNNPNCPQSTSMERIRATTASSVTTAVENYEGHSGSCMPSGFAPNQSILGARYRYSTGADRNMMLIESLDKGTRQIIRRCAR